MTNTDTIGRVARPRGVLSENETVVVANLKAQVAQSRTDYKEYCVMLLTVRGRSFSEVAKATGLSKDTLQRWKREAGR